MTSSGHPTAIFKRALQRGNLTVAEAVSKELPPLNHDALELTILIACKDPRRYRHERRRLVIIVTMVAPAGLEVTALFAVGPVRRCQARQI